MRSQSISTVGEIANNNMDTPVSRQECQYKEGVIAKRMEKIEEKIESVRLEVAQLPEKLIEKLDSRYASKQAEEMILDLQQKIEQRNYDWLKYLITALFGAVISAILIRFQ